MQKQPPSETRHQGLVEENNVEEISRQEVQRRNFREGLVEARCDQGWQDQFRGHQSHRREESQEREPVCEEVRD